VKTVDIPYTCCPSDHLPMVISVELPCFASSNTPPSSSTLHPKINWTQLTNSQKLSYQICVDNQISKHDWTICTTHGCKHHSHYENISEKVKLFVSILKQSASMTFFKKSGSGFRDKQING